MRSVLWSLVLASGLVGCATDGVDVSSEAVSPSAGKLTIQMRQAATGHVPSGRLTRAAIEIGDIANFTGEPQRFTVATDSRMLVPEVSEGVIGPGEILTLYVNADAASVAPGAQVSGRATVVSGGQIGEIDVVSEIGPVATAATCSFSYKRDKITVIKGEGGLDPALELDVDTIVHHDGTTSTVNFSGTIKNNASVTTDATIYSSSVTTGALVSRDWDVDAIEFDTLDGDDHGTGGGTLAFTCTGTGTATDSTQVNLGNAIIDVQVKAVW